MHAGNNQARKRARIQAANESETDDDASVESTSDEDRSDDGSASGSEDSDQVGSSEAESVDRFMPKGKGKGKEAARRKAAVLAAALAAANAKGKRKHKHASAERRPTAADFADVLAGEKRVPEPCVHKVSFTDCPLASAAARQSDSDEEHDAGAGAVAAPPADAPAAVARAPRAPAPAVIAEVPLAVVPQAPAAPAPVAVAPAPPVPALAADAVPNAAIAAGGAGNEAAAPALALSAPALKTLGDAVIEAFTACVTEAELASVKNADGSRKPAPAFKLEHCFHKWRHDCRIRQEGLHVPQPRNTGIRDRLRPREGQDRRHASEQRHQLSAKPSVRPAQGHRLSGGTEQKRLGSRQEVSLLLFGVVVILAFCNSAFSI